MEDSYKFMWTEMISGELKETVDDLIISLIYDNYITTRTVFRISKAELFEALLDYTKKKEAERNEAIKRRLNALYGADSQGGENNEKTP